MPLESARSDDDEDDEDAYWGRGHHLAGGFVGRSFELRESGDGDRQATGEWSAGARYRYGFASRWSIEASLAVAAREDGERPDKDEKEEAGEPIPVSAAGGRAVYVTGGFSYSFDADEDFVPFVHAGGGVVRFDPGAAGTRWRPTAVFGGGALVAWTRRMSLRFDVQSHLYSIASRLRTELTVSGGVSIQFGPTHSLDDTEAWP